MQQQMQFCVNMVEDWPMQRILDWWRACEDAGISYVGIPDSPALFRELYVSATLCATHTSRLRMMIAVTNPITRHPSVTASALFSLSELAPGRIALGIGTGDSAIWGVGLKPANVARVKEYILAVKGLLRGEEAVDGGKSLKAEWNAWTPPIDAPIYVACSGPRILRMASQVADGLIISMGFAPENIEYVRHTVKEACQEIGRNPDNLDVWWNTAVTFAPSIEEAMNVSVGVNSAWLTMGTLEGKQIPDEYKSSLLKFMKDMHDLKVAYKTPNRGRILVQRAKELGIYDWLISRAPRLWGTPADVRNRLAEFREMGLTNWIFFVGGPDLNRYDFLAKLSQEVIPTLA